MEMVTGKKVLIVDDEEGITLFCQRVLTKEQFIPIISNLPQKALELLQRELFDVLLVDVRMPEMDGFTLMREARKIQEDLAVVIMTGYGTIDTAINALQHGAEGLLLKPFSGKELVNSIQRAIEDRVRRIDSIRLRTLEPIIAVAEKIHGLRDQEQVILSLVNTIAEMMRDQSAYVLVQDHNLASWSVWGYAGEAGNTQWDFLNSIDMSAGGIYSIDDRENKCLKPIRDFLANHHLQSILIIPWQVNEEQCALIVSRTAESPNFRQVDADMYHLLVRHAALALENTRLFMDLREQIRQVEQSRQALIQAEKMAAIGRLTASIAHEINNPLQSMQNCLDLADRSELEEATRHEYLELARTELDRLMHTVKRMLDFYRPGKQIRQRVNINTVTQRVLKLLEKQIQKRDIEVLLDLSDTLPPVLVVENQIQQVLFNLVLNALDAMGREGKLTISTTKNNDNIYIDVQDTGPGIPEEQRERIFEPFVSTKEDGLGLGLAVSYGIITAHGGTIELIDGNSGAHFRITLPIGGDES